MRPSPWLIQGLQEAMELCLREGLTAEQTARALSKHVGICITRQAIIGRAYRTGVSFRRAPGGRPAMPIKIPPTKRGGRGNRPKTYRVANVELPRTNVEPFPTGKEDGCTWLHGPSSDRVWCGAPKRPGSSFCPHHHARCYLTTSVKTAMKDVEAA